MTENKQMASFQMLEGFLPIAPEFLTLTPS
jgi:hypothetical protein